MPETKSPSLKAQTTKSAIIVSHGQPSDPDPAEAALAELSDRVADLMPDWKIASATLAKQGSLEKTATEVGSGALIYPLFMTDGWFTRTTLPNRLGNDAAQILSPLGTDPALAELARDWLTQELQQRQWMAEETCLIVASHGSGKSRNSSRDTNRFATALAGKINFRDQRIGYIEEAPYLGDVVFETGPQAICLPFFAANGGHVTDDIAEALDLADFPGLRLIPIGRHAGVPALIARALRAFAECTEAA